MLISVIIIYFILKGFFSWKRYSWVCLQILFSTVPIYAVVTYISRLLTNPKSVSFMFPWLLALLCCIALLFVYYFKREPLFTNTKPPELTEEEKQNALFYAWLEARKISYHNLFKLIILPAFFVLTVFGISNNKIWGETIFSLEFILVAEVGFYERNGWPGNLAFISLFIPTMFFLGDIICSLFGWSESHEFNPVIFFASLATLIITMGYYVIKTCLFLKSIPKAAPSGQGKCSYCGAFLTKKGPRCPFCDSELQ